MSHVLKNKGKTRNHHHHAQSWPCTTSTPPPISAHSSSYEHTFFLTSSLALESDVIASVDASFQGASLAKRSISVIIDLLYYIVQPSSSFNVFSFCGSLRWRRKHDQVMVVGSGQANLPT